MCEHDEMVEAIRKYFPFPWILKNGEIQTADLFPVFTFHFPSPFIPDKAQQRIFEAVTTNNFLNMDDVEHEAQCIYVKGRHLGTVRGYARLTGTGVGGFKMTASQAESILKILTEYLEKCMSNSFKND